MKRLVLLPFLAFAPILTARALGQNLQFYLSKMNNALGKSGRVTLTKDKEGISIESDYPPHTAFLTVKYGKDDETDRWTAWDYDTAFITAPLKYLDEDQIDDFQVFSKDGFLSHKRGEEGDMTVVTFHAVGQVRAIDVVEDEGDKPLESKPGQTTPTHFDQSARDSSFLLFPNRVSAREFEKALKTAIIIEKAR